MFEKYWLYLEETEGEFHLNPNAFDLADEAFILFKSLYDTGYGSIDEDENLIAIHTGGWSENEYMIKDFEKTAWWILNHVITTIGGHYYFDTDFKSDKKWKIVKSDNNNP